MGFVRPFGFWVALAGVAVGAGCGARSGLEVDDNEGAGPGAGGMEPVPPCIDGTVETCGTDLGECVLGKRTCISGVFGPCSDVGPTTESCDGLDQDCDGSVDEDFGIGQACDGPDSDSCVDDVMTCGGCTLGSNEIEVCNGVDDNCNGEIDSDCEFGDCQPTLLVTGSVPSNPNCIDFPVEAGSTGSIQYPCEGGPVTASLGAIDFSGSVSDGFLSLDGVLVVVGPDGCSWQTEHHIEGFIPGGALTYSYSEHVVISDGMCWQPCTEVGDVVIEWVR